MKSPALAEALRPLRRLVTDAQARYEEHRLAQRIRVAEQKARRHDLARRLRDALANQEPPEALQEPVEPARRAPPPVELRYLVNDGLLQRFQLAVWPDGGGRWQNVDLWPPPQGKAERASKGPRCSASSSRA